jgi:protoporphyrinogen oxidase
MDGTRDGTAPLVAVAEAVDAARAAAVAAAEARCAAVVAEKEAVAAVESATIAADKVGLAVEAVKYQSFVQDNSMVTDFLSPLHFSSFAACGIRMWNRVWFVQEHVDFKYQDNSMLNRVWFLFVQEHVDFKYHVSVKNSL